MGPECGSARAPCAALPRNESHPGRPPRRDRRNRGYRPGVPTTKVITSALLLVALLVTGCSLQIPADPDGTLDRASGDVLHVGASVHGNLMEEEDGSVSGSEAELVEKFAKSLDARVKWSIGGEEHLVGKLKEGDLDLVIGGITDQSPWAKEVGMTRGYPGIDGAGSTPLVFLVPPGENRFLTQLERFLDDEVG